MNLPALIKNLQLDVNQDGEDTGELMQKMLEAFEKNNQRKNNSLVGSG